MIIINSLAYASFCIDFELKINLFELSFDTKNLWFFSAMMLEFSEFKLADNLKITQPLLPVSFLASSAAAAAKANFSWVKIGAAGYGTDASAGCCCQHILHFWRKIIRFLLRRLYDTWGSKRSVTEMQNYQNCEKLLIRWWMDESSFHISYFK